MLYNLFFMIQSVQFPLFCPELLTYRTFFLGQKVNIKKLHIFPVHRYIYTYIHANYIYTYISVHIDREYMVRIKRNDQPIIPIDIQQHCKKSRIEKVSALQTKKGNKTMIQMKRKAIPRKYARKLILIKVWYHIPKNIFNT